MTNQEKAAAVLSSYYSQWENNSQRNESGYDYEKTFVEMMRKVQQEVFQISVGKLPKSKNTKKNFKPV